MEELFQGAYALGIGFGFLICLIIIYIAMKVGDVE